MANWRFILWKLHKNTAEILKKIDSLMTFDYRNILSISVCNLDCKYLYKCLNPLDYLDYLAFLDAKPT